MTGNPHSRGQILRRDALPAALRPALSRRGIFGIGGLIAVTSLTGCQEDATTDSKSDSKKPGGSSDAAHGGEESGHGSEASVKTPDDALARLEEGNARFASGDGTHPRQDADAREAVADHQEPWALIHACVDSRVSPEIVFDQGVGDVFTTRTAGNILDDTIVGSMEFAVSEPYSVPVIVIMGHTACGAVTATVELLEESPNPTAPGELIDIVNEIAPVARKVPADGDDEAAHIDAVVRANAESVASNLLRRSAIIRKAVAAGRTRVVPAVYDLTSGKVEFLQDPA